MSFRPNRSRLNCGCDMDSLFSAEDAEYLESMCDPDEVATGIERHFEWLKKEFRIFYGDIKPAMCSIVVETEEDE